MGTPFQQQQRGSLCSAIRQLGAGEGGLEVSPAQGGGDTSGHPVLLGHRAGVPPLGTAETRRAGGVCFKF